MRVMLRMHVDTAAANEAVKSGRLPGIIKGVLAELKPESVYFGPSEGVRSAWIVFDMQDSSKLPVLLEPLFTELHAEIEIQPVMNLDDMMKGLAEADARFRG
ncbi:hypothetical protein ACIQUQ_17035 [Streptomyces sp. NPDC101118]|uniref:hypothetical protein n=1 Tax=Streptomyces sp. NPDC101118 TaxID=3366109 RepID=UPI0037FFAF32